MSCIFCEIVKGNIPAYKVWENDRVYAFLDIHPINPGHTLVIPKVHVPNFFELDNVDYQALMMGVKEISSVINDKIKPAKVGLMVEGWDVPHAHIHVVPLHEVNDIISKRAFQKDNPIPTEDELKSMQHRLTI